MAEISLSGKRDTDQGLAVNKVTLSDEDYNRLAYWGAKTYFPNGSPTPDEIFRAITDAVYANIKTQVEMFFAQEAAAAARASVKPLELSPAK